MSLKITPPVWPYRGVRGLDAYGSGVFMASRDGGTRRHEGLDFLAEPGDEVLASIDGTFDRVGLVYPGAELTLIAMTGTDAFAGWQTRTMYVEPLATLKAARRAGVVNVRRGQLIGHAQDVAAFWAAREPRPGPPMGNHVHLEIKITETKLVDPASFLPEGLVATRTGDRIV